MVNLFPKGRRFLYFEYPIVWAWNVYYRLRGSPVRRTIWTWKETIAPVTYSSKLKPGRNSTKLIYIRALEDLASGDYLKIEAGHARNVMLKEANGGCPIMIPKDSYGWVQLWE